jgi:hypothetical protein
MAKIVAGFMVGVLLTTSWWSSVYFGFKEWVGFPIIATILFCVLSAFVISENWEEK